MLLSNLRSVLNYIFSNYINYWHLILLIYLAAPVLQYMSENFSMTTALPVKSDYKRKIHNHIIKTGYLARFFIIRQIKLKYVPHFYLFFIYIFVIINVVFVHKSKTWKISFLCRCTKYQQNAKLTSNQTSHFRSFCVIYIGRFLAVLINIQVIRHKSKANSHQNYPQCHTLLSANIHIHGRCKRAIQRIPTLYGSFFICFLK